MTIALLVATLTFGMVLAAVAGPWVLRRAAPAFMRFPRLAIGLLAGSTGIWVLGLLALGPMLAWIISGPGVLPGGVAEVCQRCLAASSPFVSPLIETAMPVVVLLAPSVVGGALLAGSIVVDIRRRRRGTRHAARRLRARSAPRQLYGYSVLVTDEPHPFALTLPRRQGGIVISTGALELLPPDETAAVLAHEHAHLRQRHHLVTAVVASLARRLRWVPLLAAAEDAIGHYLEIAADDAARRRVGIPALASALLILGQSGHPAHQDAALDGALHALGPDRVRHLVQPRSGMAGVVSAAVAICCLTMLAVLSAVVHVPYALAAFTGCV